MLARRILSAALLAFVLTSPVTARAAENDGIVRIKSAYSMPETIKRLKKDVADKGIMFFDEIDQSKLAADAGVTLRPHGSGRGLQKGVTRNRVDHVDR